MLRQWKDRLAEKIDESQEKVRAQWLALNEREKKIITTLAGLVAVLIFAVGVKETSSVFTHVASQSESNIKNLEKIQNYVQELHAQGSELMRYERLSSKRGENFVFSAFIESEAKKFGLNIAKTSPAKVLAEDKAEKSEEWLEIQIKDGSLDSIVKFLASIEETLGLGVIELNIKTQFQDITKMDMTAVISNKKNV